MLYSPFTALVEELEALDDKGVVVVEELKEEVVVLVEEVEVVEAGMRPSMSAALWECDRQRALMGSRPSCRETETTLRMFLYLLNKLKERWTREGYKSLLHVTLVLGSVATFS